jgi:hypothetical protein
MRSSPKNDWAAGYHLPPPMLIHTYLSAMLVDLITKADLEEFRLKLLEDIKTLMSGQPAEQKKWLKRA